MARAPRKAGTSARSRKGPPRWGHLGLDGAWAIAPTWERAGAFTEGRAWVVDGGKVGFIDARGAVVVEPGYQNAWPFEGGLARVARSELDTIVIDRAGRPVYTERGVTAEGLTPVGLRRGGRTDWGVVDAAGRVVVELAFESVGLNSYAAWAKEHGDAAWRVFARTGELVHVCRPDAPSTFLTLVTKVDDRWVLKLGSDAGGTLVVLQPRDGGVVELGRLSGDSLRKDEATGAYLVRHRNDARVPHAGIFPNAAFEQAYDADLHEIPLPAQETLGDGPRVVPAGRGKDVWFGDRRVDDGPFQDAYVQGALVWVSRRQGKLTCWGAVGPDGWVIPAEHPICLRAGDDRVLGGPGKVGLVDGEGRWVLPPAHTALKRLADERVAVYEGGRATRAGALSGGAWRLRDRAGRPVGDATFADLGDAFSEDLLAAAVTDESS